MSGAKYKIGHTQNGKWGVYEQKRLPGTTNESGAYWAHDGKHFDTKEDVLKELKKMKEGKSR